MTWELVERWRKEDAEGPARGNGDGVRAMFEASSDLSAEKVGRSLQLAAALGLPEHVVLEQADWAEQESLARDVERHPLLAKWAEADRQNAALTRDDAPGLIAVADALDFEAREQSGLSLRRAAGSGDEQARAELLRRRGASEEEIRFGAITQTPNPSPLEQMFTLGREGLDQVGKSLAGAAIMASENLRGQALTLPDWAAAGQAESEQARNARLRGLAERIRESVKTRERETPAPLRSESVVGSYAQDVVRMIPQWLAQISVAYATGGAGGMAFMGGQIAGDQYLELTDKGVEPDRAMFAALTNAGLQAPLEQIGMGKFMSIFKASGLRQALLRTGETVGTEMLTEYLQSYPDAATSIWAEAEQEGRSPEESVRYFLDRLGEIHEEGLYSALVAAPFGLLGGAGRVLTDATTAREARDFVAKQKELHGKVEACRTKSLAPDHMENFLQSVGLSGDVTLPADAVLELREAGTDILTPLGMKPEDWREAADAGQEVAVPLARLHARLDEAAFAAAADIMRPAPDAMNMRDAAALNENLSADMDGLVEAAEEDAIERSAIEGELERLRIEMTEAAKSIPHLMAQIVSDTDADTTVGRYVDAQLGLLIQRARALNRMGIPISETLSRVSFQGLVRDDAGRLVTPEEAEAYAQQRAEEEALAPFWDTVWGRLNADSLRRDFPEARRELAYLHGRGLFARKGDGLAVDELADELRERGLLEADADSSTLIERLKELPRPKRKSADRRGQGVFQSGNPLASRFADMPMIDADSSAWFGEGKAIEADKKKLRSNLKEWARKNFSKDTSVSNADTGWEVLVTPRSIEKSLSHGFDELLARSVPFIPQIIEGGIHVASIEKKPGLMSHIFANKIRLDGRDYVVGFVLREDVNGNRFYDHELTEIINPDSLNADRLPGKGSEVHAARANRGEVMNILREKLGVNDGSGQVLFQSAWHGTPHRFDEFSLGATRPDADGNYVIQLFRSANLSTLTHETAHVFFLEMERLEREGLADEKMLADLAALREWTSVLDDDATLKADYDRFMKHSVAAYGGAEFERLPAWLKEDARNRAKQEMLARGFEQYLREGKAPSRKLESVFTRFRKWLMRVYREALTLHVELTDEVRDVFDRMLAHEEEMDLKAEAAGARDETARLLDALDLKGAKRLEIEGLITEAKAEAAEKLRRARDENRLKLLRGWAKEAKEQMEREKVYVARKAIRRTPIDLASFNDVNGEELGKALVKKLPGSATRREGGVEPETLAAELGYESAADMARDIVNSPTPGQRVKQLVDERQAEHDALFDADDYLFEQEQLAEQQERIAAALEEKIRAITAEQRYRREVAGKTVGGEEVRPTAEDYEDFGPLARWRVGRDQLRAQALTVLSKKPMGEEVLPEQFRRAASRWMQEERRGILRGDFGKALEANYKARLNIELAGRAAERRDLVNKLTKRTKKFLDMDKADPDARYATFWLAQNIGLFSPTRKMLANAGDKNRQNVDAFFARMREEGLLGQEDIDIWLFAEERRSWKGMTWEEFRPYAEAMTIIMHMERESRTANTAQGRVDLEAKAKEIAASIYANNAHREPGALVKRSKAGKLLREIHAAHLKADTIALLLDGDSMGPAYAAIMRPINEATWNRAERLRQGRDALKKLFSVYSRRELVEMKSKRFTVPGVAAPITKEQALGVLLNSGNASNLQRLMSGQKLTRDQVQAIIDTLDERDVRFAQSVWDYFETFRKESFDLEESLTGVRPEAVKAQPVQTRFGMLRGGYYPVAYDTDLSALPADQDKVGTQTSGRVASVDHGSMKQRTATGLGTPLALSLDVIPRHVSETAHMLAFRRPVLEVGKILRRKEVNGAIQETAGVEIAKALRDWLAYVAGERPARTGWNKAASWARKNAALYAMGFKLSTMLSQVTGLLAATSEIGLKWTLRGVADTYGRGNPLEVYRTVTALSPMMRNRITSIDRDVFEASSKLMDTGSTHRALDPFVRMKSFMETKGFVPVGVIQMAFSDLPTWNGAYAKALTENGGDIEAAARYADAVVERTQVGGAEKDLAAVQRGSELGKLMTMFYSYFSALYNLSARRVTMLHRRRDAASVYRLGTLMLLTWFAEPVLMGTLLGKAPDDEGDDWEDWLSWGAKEAFFNPFNMVVGVRDVASMVDSYVSGYSGRYRLSSALDVFDSAMKFGIQAGKILEGGGDEKELVLAGGKAVGQATGFVNAQALLILETFWDWLDGTSPELELGNLIRKKN